MSEPTYFVYDKKIPDEEKKLVVSTAKLPAELLEKMVLDVRRNKAKLEQQKAN